MADSGMSGSSSIDPGTASGITEREPIKLVSRKMRAFFLGLTPEEQQIIERDPSYLNVAFVAKTYKKARAGRGGRGGGGGGR